MTDFVLQQDITDIKQRNSIVNYANFLKQPLKLEMFIVCDEDGNVFEEPINNFNLEIEDSNKWIEYNNAKEKVLFEGFEVIGIDKDVVQLELHGNNLWIDFHKDSSIILTDNYDIEFHVKIIEDLIEYNLQLTENALKQIGL